MRFKPSSFLCPNRTALMQDTIFSTIIERQPMPGRSWKKLTFNIGEAVLTIILFALFIHFTTYRPPKPISTLQHLILPLSIIIVFLTIYALSSRKRPLKENRLWLFLAAFSTGFWIFHILRTSGFAVWPLSRTHTFYEYKYLLISHLVMVTTVFAAFLWIGGKKTPFRFLRFGDWRKIPFTPIGPALLMFLSAAIGICCLMLIPPSFNNAFQPWPLWCAIIFAKALLTGLSEETVYRGILLPVCMDRYGGGFGIILQSTLYTIFHIHLGSVIFDPGGFLAIVFVLGLLFGVITRLTDGIGCVCILHTAISLLVELSNVL